MFLYFFFFKQKTAYEMRISDWSSDVCSSDLIAQDLEARAADLRTMIALAAASAPANDVVSVGSGPAARAAIAWGAKVSATFRARVWWIADTISEIGRASCRERVCKYV